MKHYFLLLLLLFSCSKNQEQILTEEEYTSFGNGIILSLEKGNLKKLKNHKNLERVYANLEKQITYFELNSKVSNTKWKSYRVELHQQFNVYLKSLISLAQKPNCQIELSKYYKKDGIPHIVIAINSPEAVEFADFELVTIGDRTYITDYQSYNTGFQFSESFIWNALNKLEYGWLGGEYMNALSEIKNANIFLERGEPERAWTAINRVPEYFIYHNSFQIIKVNTASQLGDSLYIESLYEWIGQNWDQEGFRHLKSYEFYSIIGDTIEANASLDSLEMIAGKCTLTKNLRLVSK
ncbi:hypothetical protein R9C00_03440 [Flammeovirgaceae bacterium SG7u.111]|nr:hypothetical protein [Flammeovirgaceae bacterium SG7u.132]WPO36497.1 hypothetical protein R9C00_03440 [Flammeovirgaceae bacterium SG7u.111]